MMSLSWLCGATMALAMALASASSDAQTVAMTLGRSFCWSRIEYVMAAPLIFVFAQLRRRRDGRKGEGLSAMSGKGCAKTGPTAGMFWIGWGGLHRTN